MTEKGDKEREKYDQKQPSGRGNQMSEPIPKQQVGGNATDPDQIQAKE